MLTLKPIEVDRPWMLSVANHPSMDYPCLKITGDLLLMIVKDSCFMLRQYCMQADIEPHILCLRIG